MATRLYQMAAFMTVIAGLLVGCGSQSTLLATYATSLEDERQGNLDKARKGYQKLLSQKAGIAGIHNNLARLEVSYGRIQSALSHFAEERQTHPEVAAAWSNALLILGTSRDFRSASTLIDEALKRFPDDPVIHLARGLILLRSGGDVKAVEAALEKAIAFRKPGVRAMAHYLRGLVRGRAGKNQQAADDFGEAIKLGQGGAAHYNRAVALWFAAGPEVALSEISVAQRFSPRDPSLAILEALVYLQLNKLVDSTKSIAQAKQIGGSNHKVDFIEGLIQLRNKDFQKSVTSFSRVVRLKPKWAAAHFNLGLAYVGLNELAKAREHFGRTMALTPNDKAAVRNWKTLGALLGK